MALHEHFWEDVLRFLGDGTVAKVGSTCRMLYFIARDELRLRARHYLKSDNAWEHAFYPARGYYDKQGDCGGDGDEMGSGEGMCWVRCVCEHHKMVFLGRDCSCESGHASERPGSILKSYRRGVFCEYIGGWMDWAGSDPGREVRA